MQRRVQGHTVPPLPATNIATSSGELVGGYYQGDGAEALAGLLKARALDDTDQPSLLLDHGSLNTEHERPEPVQDDAMGIRITYPLNDEVLLFGDVTLAFETRGFTAAADTPIEVSFFETRISLPHMLGSFNSYTQ